MRKSADARSERANERSEYPNARFERVRAHLMGSAEVMRLVTERSVDAILAAADVITQALRAGGKILLCGNGGSAADCLHLAAEFMNRLTKTFDRPGLAAIALTADTAFLTAFANDIGFEGVFARQVRTLGKPGDVLIGISTSGDSPNVIGAIEAACESKMHTIAMTGTGGRLGAMASVTISIPSANTQHIQEAHLAVGHVMCQLVERDLFGDVGPRGVLGR